MSSSNSIPIKDFSKPIGEDLKPNEIKKPIEVLSFGEAVLNKWYNVAGIRIPCNNDIIDDLWKQWIVNPTAKRADDTKFTIFAVDVTNPMLLYI